MRGRTIYRSREGEARIRALYESELEGLGVDFQRVMIKTGCGGTHVVSVGPQGAPPLVLVHGLYAPAPYALELFLPLASAFMIYAPDVAGQTGVGSTTRPMRKSNGYGRWLAEVLDGLGLERAAMIGVSFGAAVVLDLAAVLPGRITKAVLVTPAGFTGGVAPRLFVRLSIPWLLYRICPDIAGRFMRRLWDRRVGYDVRFFKLFDAAMRDVRLFIRPPGPFRRKDLDGFTAPVLVMLARDDALIPANSAGRHAEKIIPALFGVAVFDGPHIPKRETLTLINERIMDFLGGRNRENESLSSIRRLDAG